jgi:hypothetical protein
MHVRVKIVACPNPGTCLDGIIDAVLAPSPKLILDDERSHETGDNAV